MSDLGEVKHYLGIDISCDVRKGNVKQSQEQAFRRTVTKFGMEKRNRALTPMKITIFRSHIDDERDVLSNKPNDQHLGCIMYAMLCTCPYLSFFISILSKFLESHSEQPWCSTKRVLRYLQPRASYNLIYRSSNECKLVTYTYADWGSSYGRKFYITYSGLLQKQAGFVVAWERVRYGIVVNTSWNYSFYLSSAWAKMALRNRFALF